MTEGRRLANFQAQVGGLYRERGGFQSLEQNGLPRTRLFLASSFPANVKGLFQSSSLLSTPAVGTPKYSESRGRDAFRPLPDRGSCQLVKGVGRRAHRQQPRLGYPVGSAAFARSAERLAKTRVRPKFKQQWTLRALLRQGRLFGTCKVFKGCVVRSSTAVYFAECAGRPLVCDSTALAPCLRRGAQLTVGSVVEMIWSSRSGTRKGRFRGSGLGFRVKN